MGGITEVYKPHGKNLYYYDVNSLYPFVALQDMPGLDYQKVEYFIPMALTDDMFGFFECQIKVTNDKYLGVLPVKHGSGMYFPTGE
jgi:hypothetical protein